MSVAAVASAVTIAPYPPYQVRSDGVPAGQVQKRSGSSNTSSKAVLHVTDIFGLPLLQNKLLADSFAANGYLVVMPDLFGGDAVSVEEQEAGLRVKSVCTNMMGKWFTQHPPAKIDTIIHTTISYMRQELGVSKIAGLGTCFGGKYVPRFLTPTGGIDVGFIAHPSNLVEAEIRAIGTTKAISIAAGTLDASFNATAKAQAERILSAKNVTFQTNTYAGAPHGFAVRVDQNVPQQAYAKQASFVQAVTWFNAWL
ncbi:hypothetical protein ACEQ8H_007344 [Pleosporales sp. CAS-2024a]